VAVHIVTGRYVHFAGPVVNVHDAKLFQEGPLPTAFDEDDDRAVSPRKGLADRGYYSSKPSNKLYQCLMSVMKKPRDGELTEYDIKMNQLISTLRIEVERGIGRLRRLKRLDDVFTAKGTLETKLAKHAQIFKIGIHFTNFSMEYMPLRKTPHWLLCKGPIPTRRVRRMVNAFLASAPGTHISSMIKPQDRALLTPELGPEEEQEEQ